MRPSGEQLLVQQKGLSASVADGGSDDGHARQNALAQYFERQLLPETLPGDSVDRSYSRGRATRGSRQLNERKTVDLLLQ